MAVAEPPLVLFKSPDEATIYTGSPALCRLPSGRLIASFDLRGSGAADLPGPKTGSGKNRSQCRIQTSDDGGVTWTERAQLAMVHARPFLAGGKVYQLGHAGDLRIARSDDDGTTWTEAIALTQGEHWHQAPCNLNYHGGRVYLVMEKNTDPSFKGWAVSVLAPVVMSADVTADLTQPSSWTYSNALSFRDAVQAAGRPRLLGVPFFTPGNTAPDNPGDRRYMAPPGWLETHVVRFIDPAHVWFDPAGRTVHLLARAHTGTSNVCCVAKCVEAEDGSLTVSLENAPSGEPILYLPCPGGHLKFHVVYDELSERFWMVSNQSVDSMTRPDRLPPNRYNLPNNERHRLVLHFSTNCVDWCFAGVIECLDDPRASRNYATLIVDGDDLRILARSGDETAKSSHDGNLVTFHTVRAFRDLVY